MKEEYATVPKLGFGCMRLPLTDPKDVTAIDVEQVKQMVDAFMQAGGTYFDTAFVYHNGQSEVALREALVERYPRESFTIATKCLAWALPDAATWRLRASTTSLLWRWNRHAAVVWPTCPKPWPRRFWPFAPTSARCRGRTASASTSPIS